MGNRKTIRLHSNLFVCIFLDQVDRPTDISYAIYLCVCACVCLSISDRFLLASLSMYLCSHHFYAASVRSNPFYTRAFLLSFVVPLLWFLLFVYFVRSMNRAYHICYTIIVLHTAIDRFNQSQSQIMCPQEYWSIRFVWRQAYGITISCVPHRFPWFCFPFFFRHYVCRLEFARSGYFPNRIIPSTSPLEDS